MIQSRIRRRRISGATQASVDEAVAAAVAASTPQPKGYLAGWSYGPSGGGATTRVMAVGSLNVAPFMVRQTQSFDRITAEVTAGAGVGGVVRLGLWNHNPLTGLPGTLILDAGTIDGTSVSVQSKTILQELPQGIVWMGAVAQVAGNPTMRAYNGGLPLVPAWGTTPISNNGTCVVVSGVTGALGTLVGAAFLVNVVTCPIILLRAV